MAQEVIEVTQREVEIIEVIERGPVGPTGPQPDINYEVVSSARTLEAADLIAADTSGGSFTLTLPANPSNGDAVDIFDFSETFDTNPLTIARNGSRIESLEENLVCNVEGAYFTLIYTGSTRGWQVLPRYGTSGGGGESALTTQGDMLYRGAAVNTRLGIGTAGQILKVNSTATAPEWGAAPATGVTSVSGTAPIASSGGATPTISISAATTSAAGSMSSADKTKLDGIAANANNYTHPNHSGDVTSVGDGATTIANDAVTNAKLANVATATIKGRATAGTGDPEDLTATQARTILNVADGAEANVQANWTEADSGSDAFILNKPSTFAPTAHAASHAVGGSDPLAPSDIGAQSLFVTDTSTLLNISSNVTLTARRAVIYSLSISSSAAGNYTIDPPITNSLVGDVIIVTRPPIGPTNAVTFLNGLTGSFLASILQGERYRFVFNGSLWNLDPVQTHTHAASAITSGTLDIARIPTGTSSSTVCIGNDARLSDARTPTSHTHAASDITSGSFGNISHDGKVGTDSGRVLVTTTAGAVTTLALGTANQVLRVNSGATAVEFADPAASGVTGAAASASDVLGVSGSDITGVDAGSADRLVFWDDSASKLTYLEAGSGLSISGTTLTATSTFDPASPDPIGTTTPNTGAFTSLSTAPAANTKAFTTTGYSLTGSNAQSLVDLAGTWNTTGTPSAIKLNITDTASNASSLLMQLQTGGADRFTITKAGNATCNSLRLTGGSNVANGIVTSSSSLSLQTSGASFVLFSNSFTCTNTTTGSYINFTLGRDNNFVSNLWMLSTGSISFGNGGASIVGESSNVLSQRAGTSAQEKQLYGTFTSSTNYQRMTIKSVKQTLSALSGASATTTGTFIPDGAVVVGVTTRVATALTGAAGYTIGDGTDADRWGDITGTAIGTTSDNRDWTAGTIECFTAGGEITLTAKTSNFTAGAIEICVFYLAGQAD